MDFFEVVHTQRSIRKFKDQPVPAQMLWEMIDAAIRAPSGSNTQPWGWLIVQDRAKRGAIAAAVLEGVGDVAAALAEADKLATTEQRRMRRSSISFRANVMSAPVLV